MKKIIGYFKGVGKETRRIRWPERSVLIPSIIVVVSITVFAALFIALEDYGASTLLEQLRQAFEQIK